MKVHYKETHIYFYYQRHSIVIVPPGDYEENEEVDLSRCVMIPLDCVHDLVEFLEKSGYLKPRLDERLRTEDLKITHRLLDLLDKKIPGGINHE